MQKELKMGKMYVVLIIILSAFLYSGVEGSEDASMDLSGLEFKIDKLIDRVSLIEENVNSLQGTIQSMKFAEESLLNLTSRLVLIEQMIGTSPVRAINSLKEAVAELRKRMDHQGVTISLIEQKSRSVEKPLEPLKKAIEEQVNAISEIIERLNKEEERFRLSKLQDGKQIPAPQENISKELTEVFDMFPGIKEELRIGNILKEQGYREVGGGFHVKDIRFASFGMSVECTGTVMNASGTDHSLIHFKIFVYNDKGNYLKSQSFSIKGVKNGSAKSFSDIISGVEMEEIKKYAFVFGEDGVPEELMDLEKENTRNEDLRELDELEEKQVEMQAYAELVDGFKEVGGGFYVKDVTFTDFGGSCKLDGTLRNLSDKSYGAVFFTVGLFGENKQLILKHDFYVTDFVGYSIKDFSETIKGIRYDDFSSYEITFAGMPAPNLEQ